MSAKELGSDRDNRPHEETIEIKDLLKVLIQSQAILAEAQAQQAKSQENMQNQMLEQAKSQESIQNQMLKFQENMQNQMLEQAKSQENIQNQMLEQAKSQESIQNQMLEVLRSNSAGNNKQQDDDEEDDDDDDKSEGPDGVNGVRVAEYNPDINELLLLLEGDCEETIEFLRHNPEALNQGVTPTSETVLHMAIENKREMKLIKEIVNLMPPELLEYQSTDFGSTALHLAAQYGNAEAVVWMVNKNPRLHLILDKYGRTPLDKAIGSVTMRQKEIVEYLYSVTIDAVPSLSSNTYGANLLCRLIEANFYDTALCLIKRFPEYINKKSEAFNMYGLEMIVRRPSAFRSGTKLSWWQNLIYSLIHVDMNTTCIQQVEPNKCQCSDCTIRDDENPLPESINCTKVEESSKVFFSSTDCKVIIMTYLTRGAALRMQQEVQWFKGVESMLRESDRFKINKNGDTAHFKFTEEHKELMKEGRDWLKDTSGSCMIVGALIATVSFAAAFTVPGGNISDTNNPLIGTPIFLGKPSFTVFAVADALALISSMTSVLMFLAIYTSRFRVMDFLKSLPQKLIFGVATLFVSMVAILVAFGASLFIVVGSRFAQALLPITLISCFPLGLFAWLQLPLFVEMVRSTYWGVLFKKHRYIDPSTMKDANKSRKKKKEH